MPPWGRNENGEKLYCNPVLPLGTSCVLAFTGVGIEWMILGGFAMLAAGMALQRIVPKRRRKIENHRPR